MAIINGCYDELSSNWSPIVRIGSNSWVLLGEPLMKRYVIHTENKDEAWITELLAIGFDGYTLVKADGAWKGEQEKSLEIILYTSNTELVRAMAERIKHHNKQDAVLIAETECRLEFV